MPYDLLAGLHHQPEKCALVLTSTAVTQVSSADGLMCVLSFIRVEHARPDADTHALGH